MTSGSGNSAYFTHPIRAAVSRSGQPELAVRLQKAGIRHTFKLNTANQDKAARKAVQIFASLLAVGWSETLKRFGVEKPSRATHARKVTIGQYLAAAEAVFDRKPKTFRLYAIYLRRIVSEIFGIDGGKARWDYRAGARQLGQEVDAIRLAAITPAKLQAWRIGFINRASNPALRASATRSSNSYLRCARSLFSPKIAGFVSEKFALPSRCRSMALTSSGRDCRNTKVKLTCRC